MNQSPSSQVDQVIDIVSGSQAVDQKEMERRGRERLPYSALVAFLPLGPGGEHTPIQILRARNLSVDGISVDSRSPIEVGTVGALQIMRSNGAMAVLGVRIAHCRYMGSMQHIVGIEFRPLPTGLVDSDFVGKSGRMKLLDAVLEQNRSG